MFLILALKIGSEGDKIENMIMIDQIMFSTRVEAPTRGTPPSLRYGI